MLLSYVQKYAGITNIKIDLVKVEYFLLTPANIFKIIQYYI